MSQESVERLSEIWSAWGFKKYPQNVKLSDFLEPLEAEAHAKEGSPLDLRAVQCLLLDPEHVHAAHRTALRDATRCWPAEWRVGSEEDVAFVQAMLLAVRPTAPALAELMVAGRVAQRGRDRQMPRLRGWLASGRKEESRRAGEVFAAPSVTRSPLPSFTHVDSAVEYLSRNTNQAWHYSSVTPFLLNALDELNLALCKEADSTSEVDWGIAGASMKALRDNANNGWNYPSFSTELITVLQHFDVKLAAFGYTQALEPSLGKLIETRTANHGFNGYGRDLVQALVQVKSGLLSVHHIRETQSWQDEYGRWAETVTAQAQSQNLASAEQKLLWWGQSRYCSPLRLPYRALRANPIATVWWAAVEVAELGKPLEFAPLSAFLVNTLETLGLDVNEKKPASAWLASLAEVLKAVPSELRKHVTPKDPLKSLAEKDALGLPVTWLRLDNEGELSGAVALDLNLEIDLGDLSEWLLGEFLLDHRMAP